MFQRSQGLCGLLAAVIIAAGAAASAQQKVELKMQTAFGANLPAAGTVAKHLSETIEKVSGGALVLRFYDVNRLVPALEIHNAVAAGSIDSGWTTPTYMIGRAPAAALYAGGPFGPEAVEFMGWLYRGGGLQLWREIYAAHGLVPTPCGLMEPEAGGWFTKEIKSAEDLKGLKVRFAGIGGEVLKRLGASVTLLPVGEIYPSLERRVIDGTEVSMPAIDRILGLHRVAKFYYVPGWHQPASVNELVVNKAVWEKLSASHRATIEIACRDAMVQGGTETIVGNAKALQFFREQGVQVKSYSPELIALFRKTTEEVYAEFAAKNADFKRVYDSMQRYRSETRDWVRNNVVR